MKAGEQDEMGESSHYPVGIRVRILVVEIKGLEGVGAAVRQLLGGVEGCSHCGAGGTTILGSSGHLNEYLGGRQLLE